MQNSTEFSEKQKRIASLLDNEKLDGVVLSTQANFSWFTCGASSHVAISTDVGVAHVVAKRDNTWIICENIEAARIKDEEVGKLGVQVLSCNWWEGGQKQMIERLIGSSNYASDTGLFGTVNIEPGIAPLRYSLTPEEIDRYRWVGRNTAECIDIACRKVEPGMTEHEAAGVLNKEIISRGMIPQVTLIAADERIGNYRHPIPTDKTIDKYVMLVTGTRRWGLVVSMTRLVHFGKIPDELRRKHSAVTYVDAVFINRTRPGVPIADVFNRGVQAYIDQGFSDEWKLHHQGGPTGYKGREFRGTSTVTADVLPNQAYAWNPSITGTKSEDTLIALPDNTEIISTIPGWPTVEVNIDGKTYLRPDILQR